MVEWKKLGEICTIITGGDAPDDCIKGQKTPSSTHPYPVYSNGDDVYGYTPIYRINKDAVTISSIGNVGSVNYRTKNFTPIIRLKVVIPHSDLLSTKYLYYSLLDFKFVGTNSSLSSMKAADIKKVSVPIPPLSEQTQIVGILDTFTASIENLKEQIAQRRKQYEYYRDQLLDLEGKPGVEMKTLGELSYKISSGRNKNKEDQGQYPVFGSTGIIAYTNSYLFDKPLILVARVGANAGYVYMINEKCDVTDNTLIVETKEDNNRKFIYYYLVYMNINQFAKGGGQPLITGGLLKDLLIPLPPLQKQQRIVSILDTFEASIQNLEAQLEQREKQYEYYRNKLLTFK